MALELVLTRDQTVAVSLLTTLGSCPRWRCNSDEWDELAAYMPLQREYLTVYAAVLTTPDFQLCEPDALGSTTQAADWQFEDRQAARYENGSLQL